MLALECKASNSEVNSFKRLNKEVVGDAKDWVTRFGKNVVVPAAALQGVFKATNVESAQDTPVYMFWGHRLNDLTAFIQSTK